MLVAASVNQDALLATYDLLLVAFLTYFLLSDVSSCYRGAFAHSSAAFAHSSADVVAHSVDVVIVIRVSAVLDVRHQCRPAEVLEEKDVDVLADTS